MSQLLSPFPLSFLIKLDFSFLGSDAFTRFTSTHYHVYKMQGKPALRGSFRTLAWVSLREDRPLVPVLHRWLRPWPRPPPPPAHAPHDDTS